MNNLIDNKTESNGEPLTWPISEKLIGRKVRFDGYVTGSHSHWDFVVGEEYLIDDVKGAVGPVNIRGNSLSTNFSNDFKFILLPDQKIPVGYYYSDEENKLKPLKNESIVQYNASDVVLKIPAPEKVKLPQHYQTELTKREMFAMYAMQGILSNHSGIKPSPSRIAEISVSYADALLAELEKKETDHDNQ